MFMCQKPPSSKEEAYLEIGSQDLTAAFTKLPADTSDEVIIKEFISIFINAFKLNQRLPTRSEFANVLLRKFNEVSIS